MVYPSSGSLLYKNIQTGLSTLITVKIKGVTVGAIQELRIEQNREFTILEEIGTDGIVEIHPKGAAKIGFTVQRIVFDQLRLPESFSRGFLNIQAQRIPFDIDIIDNVFDNSIFSIVHSLKGCWFRGYTIPFNANNYIITETANLVCEKIISSQNNKNVSNGGFRNIPIEIDSIERQTDLNGIPGNFEPSI